MIDRKIDRKKEKGREISLNSKKLPQTYIIMTLIKININKLKNVKFQKAND